jgi:hypothetical protein
LQIYETVYTKKYKQGIFFHILVKKQLGFGMQNLHTHGYVGKPAMVNISGPGGSKMGCFDSVHASSAS